MFMDEFQDSAQRDDCLRTPISGGKDSLEAGGDQSDSWRLESFGGSNHIWHLGWPVKKTRFLTNSNTPTCPPTPHPQLSLASYKMAAPRVVRLLTCVSHFSSLWLFLLYLQVLFFLIFKF